MGPDVNVDCVETCRIFRADFYIIPYSVTNNGLPSNNLFRFQGNLVKVSCIVESVRNDFALIYFN
jgi:hypothetical protein